MSHNPPARRTLADIIQEKITEKQTEIQSQMTGELRLMNLRLIPRKLDVWLKINIARSVVAWHSGHVFRLLTLSDMFLTKR